MASSLSLCQYTDIMLPAPHLFAAAADHISVAGTAAAVYIAAPVLWLVGVALFIWHKLRRG